ncbi:transcriptional regulator [Rhizobium sp. CF142]|nr:LacI family DNA-binding transcriptional regulator [Rhizobium sp. CF142]EJJ31498.1 transcriptional regulator [Rhizobium sp. CF142]
MASIKDVAKQAGVSNGTVSRYFHQPDRVHEETRNKIREAIDQLGYAPNASAQSFRLGNTGIVLVLTSSIGDAFYGDVIAGIIQVANTKGYGVRVQEVQPGKLAAGELDRIAASRQADGIIVLGDAGPFPASRRTDQIRNRPAIVVCGETSDPELLGYPRFQIDGFAAAAELTNFLIGLGHREIGFMRGEIASINLHERESGFRSAMKQAGITIAEDWLCNGQFTIKPARRAIADFLNAKIVPTALICANDEMALGAMAELQSRGIRVPQDVSVVGFDDTRYADVANPPLTTIAQPASEIGERGMYCLLQAIRGEEPQTAVEYLAHRLIVRKSTRFCS